VTIYSLKNKYVEKRAYDVNKDNGYVKTFTKIPILKRILKYKNHESNMAQIVFDTPELRSMILGFKTEIVTKEHEDYSRRLCKIIYQGWREQYYGYTPVGVFVEAWEVDMNGSVRTKPRRLGLPGGNLW